LDPRSLGSHAKAPGAKLWKCTISYFFLQIEFTAAAAEAESFCMHGLARDGTLMMRIPK
jgi:hypothetical protein